MVKNYKVKELSQQKTFFRKFLLQILTFSNAWKNNSIKIWSDLDKIMNLHSKVEDLGWYCYLSQSQKYKNYHNLGTILS